MNGRVTSLLVGALMQGKSGHPNSTDHCMDLQELSTEFLSDNDSTLLQLTSNDLEPFLGTNPNQEKVFHDLDQQSDGGGVFPRNPSPPGLVPGGDFCGSPDPFTGGVATFYDEPSATPCACPGGDRSILGSINPAEPGATTDSLFYGRTAETSHLCTIPANCSDDSWGGPQSFVDISLPPSSLSSSSSSTLSQQISQCHHLAIPQTVTDCVKSELRPAITQRHTMIPGEADPVNIKIKTEPLDPEMEMQYCYPPAQDEVRRERRREQNRRAAAKCRDKRRKNNEIMHQNYEKVIQENKQRKREVVELRQCVAELQNQLRLHGQKCGLDLRSSSSLSSSSSSWKQITPET